MDYRVLGPLEVRDRDHLCEIGGPKQRAVLAVLVAAAGRPVAVDTLLQAVYGDDASPTMRRSLQTYVSNLRHSLDGTVVRQGESYRLELDGCTVDAATFEAAVGRAGAIVADDPATAARELREALAMWRGPPYADVEAHGRLDSEIARFTEMQLVATETRFEAELALGHHRDIVAEIEALAAEHPWRERLRALHMTALYRSGRQADALRAYEETRRALAEHLGIDPSRELSELERRILVHDPALLVANDAAPDGEPPVADAPAAAAPAPAGVLTFVYTDIEGSTRLLRELGDTYDELIDVHRRIARAVWDRHGGTELATEGDGFVVMFPRAHDALAATVDLQRTLHDATWPTTRPVRVRVGVHTGFARYGSTGYSSLALHQAARVVGAAHGDQILLTGDTMATIGQPADVAADARIDVKVRSLGRFRVRDFDIPVELFTVQGPGLPTCDAAPRVPPAERHNIVRPATALVDRVDECHRLTNDLSPSRLVTLLGPGGVGKTRLAVDAALAVVDSWRDGVWFVDLAPVGRPDLVDAAVADVLGAAASATSRPRDRILGHLDERHVLLVLDNCEHVSPAAAELVDAVLSRCPQVGVLATSRSSLGIRAERVHRIGPLAVDDGVNLGPAIELFEARAGAVSPAERSDVAELCRELDGLPLAIELAAVRAHTVPPGELVARLRRVPSSLATSLTSSDPGLPQRQRSLARVLDWSIERLDPDQRRVLRRLTVFRGGFDLDDALAVCTTPDLTEGEVVDHLWGLVDCSLVEIDPAAGETRYRLLTIVRKHVEAGADETDLDGAWMRLGDHLREMLGPERELDRRWITRMAIEIDNVRAVVDHPATPVAVAQALAWAVGKYHDLTDSFRAGITELERWVSHLSTESPELVAMLTLLADLHLRLGDHDAAEECLDRAGEVAGRSGPADWDSAGLVRARADLAMRLGDIAGAIEGVEAELRNRHPRRASARLWNTLGIARGAAGDMAGAIAAFESELADATASGTEAFLKVTHSNLAEAKLQLGDRAGAAHHQLISLEFARAHRHPVSVAFSMMIAARLIESPERFDDVVRLQVVADELLAQEGFELYADDRQVRAELLDGAREVLGADEFERVASEARSFDPDAAAELATSVLNGIRSPAGESRRAPPQ